MSSGPRRTWPFTGGDAASTITCPKAIAGASATAATSVNPSIRPDSPFRRTSELQMTSPTGVMRPQARRVVGMPAFENGGAKLDGPIHLLPREHGAYRTWELLSSVTLVRSLA